MLTQKITKIDVQNLEDKVRDMHFDVNMSDDRKNSVRNFWTYHVKGVIENSRRMATKYGGDEIVVWLGAALHDVALVCGEEPHDEIGAQQAFDFLIQSGVDDDTARKVKGIVLSHRCKKVIPQTLEEKIVASADTICHFDMYSKENSVVSKHDYHEILKMDFSELEREYEEKVFFDDEKDILKNKLEKFQKTSFYKNKECLCGCKGACQCTSDCVCGCNKKKESKGWFSFNFFR